MYGNYSESLPRINGDINFPITFHNGDDRYDVNDQFSKKFLPCLKSGTETHTVTMGISDRYFRNLRSRANSSNLNDVGRDMRSGKYRPEMLLAISACFYDDFVANPHFGGKKFLEIVPKVKLRSCERT
ncbi:hypothetical protein J6590_002575 [Homalodisca vitripennis]|nr:hypothetical protein J6590_002575 [Homalodisca vitripennis]